MRSESSAQRTFESSPALQCWETSEIKVEARFSGRQILNGSMFSHTAIATAPNSVVRFTDFGRSLLGTQR